MGVLGLVAGSSGSSGGGAAAAGLLLVIYLIVFAVWIVAIVGMWKTFEKAGQKGWLAIIPILNLWVLIKIAGREPWWLAVYIVGFFCFIAAIAASVVISIDVAKQYGKSAGFGIGLAFLPFIFYPMLGFGDDRYQGPPLAPIV